MTEQNSDELKAFFKANLLSVVHLTTDEIQALNESSRRFREFSLTRRHDQFKR
jgi:hypothetical protein